MKLPLVAKENFELLCRDHGVIPQSYLSDNAKNFTAKEFSERFSLFKQVIWFAGVGAHHHNGNAERAICTIMSIARTMMLHSAIHWPEVTDSTLWPMAVSHAVYLHNHMPNLKTGLAPVDVFTTKSRCQQHKFHDLHVRGCPIYVLDKSFSDCKKLPRWQPPSTRRSINMGLSAKHASQHCPTCPQCFVRIHHATISMFMESMRSNSRRSNDETLYAHCEQSTIGGPSMNRRPRSYL